MGATNKPPNDLHDRNVSANDELEKIMATPDVVRVLTAQGFDSFRATSGVAFSASVRRDVDIWGSLVRASNATVD